ncbi:MAG: lipoprotein-releasing ABC transporter permease subunit [Deltaproteobacteria bacterium]|nr:lipoprotein-releasing ABC transporter permease subunit [Deltaproteobacteria bacterium]
MRYELLVGLRYLRAKRKERFISLITVISTLGVVVGVVTLNVVLAVMTGFEEDLRDRILGFNPQIVVEGDDGTLADPDQLTRTIRSIPGVVAAAPYASGQVMLSAEGNVTGAMVRGIGPEAREVLDVETHLREGSLDQLGKMFDAPASEGQTGPVKLPGIIIGKDISRQLGLLVGDPVTVISPLSMPSAVGLVPRVKRFAVVGIFDSGMSEYDAALVYMDLPSAQRFFDLDGKVNGIEVRSPEIYDAKQVGDRIRAALGKGFVVRDWMETNRNIFAALRMEKYVYFIVLLLIVLVAAFNIVATLIMVVMEKRKDVAILKSMGATSRSINRIFRYKGLIIGVLGTAVGNVVAFALCLVMQRYQVVPLPKDVFYVNTLPIKMQPEYFVMVTVASLLIVLLATIYPARQAARLTPVDVIRYE